MRFDDVVSLRFVECICGCERCESDDAHAGCFGGFDAADRVFDDGAVLRLMPHGCSGVEEEVRLGFPLLDLVSAEERFMALVVGVGEALDQVRSGEGHTHFAYGSVRSDATLWRTISVLLCPFIERIQQIVDAIDRWHAFGLEDLIADAPVVFEQGGQRATDLLLDFGVDLVKVPAFEVSHRISRIDRPASVGHTLRKQSVGDGFAINQHSVAVEDDESSVLKHGECTGWPFSMFSDRRDH